jgi:dCTP deaminase
VHLARGDDCFLIWYASLDKESTMIRKSPPFEGITSKVLNPIAGEIQSLQGLSDRITEVEHEQHAANVRTGILITLAFALMILAITLIAKAWPATATPLGSSPRTSQDVSPSISSPAMPAGSPRSDQLVSQPQNPQPAGTPPSSSSSGETIRGRSQPPPK